MANENEKKYASLESLRSFKENADKLYATQTEVDELSADVTNKANVQHIHSISDVTNLQTALDEINDDISQKSQVQMITPDALEILSTLKIHKLTQEEYNQAFTNGTLEDNALYLTPEEEIDMSGYATTEQLNTKADAEHTHNDTYYTETEIDTLLEGKANTSHNHNEEYDAKGAAAEAEQNAKSYADGLVCNYASKEHSHTVSNITDFNDSVNTLIEEKGYTDAIATAKQESITAAADDATIKADTALVSAKSYADSATTALKNDLLNGAGAAYDTLKELGDLINENVDAIEALETVASGKADVNHTHNDIYYTETEINNKVSAINTSITTSLSEAKSYSDANLGIAKTYADNAVSQKTQVQFITWEVDD